MLPDDGLARQSRRAGDLEQMGKDIVLHALEIIRRDLPCHIHGDPALQAQHHIIKAAVQIVDLVELQAFF